VVNRAYGLADLERKLPITPDTVFDAGSVVKQFVAAATLLLVEEKRLSLTEDVRKYIPELPDYGYRITLNHLLTHTSGVRDWTGLGPLTGRKVDALTLTLRQRALNFAPGEEWAYSNSGYVLLKEIVARTSKMPFGEFARRRLFEPLGMKSSAYLGDLREVARNGALAYERAGLTWRVDVQLGNERGGGGALFTTAVDLITWNEALMGGRLGKFVTATIQAPATLNNGRTLGYARGLFLQSTPRGPLVWHSGGAGGYSTLLGRFTKYGVAIAIMCNASEGARDAYARSILDALVPAASAAREEPTVSAITPVAGVDVKDKAGLFFNERDGMPLRLVEEKGQLRVAGGPPLVPVASDRFRNPRASLSFMSGDEFELHFVSPTHINLRSKEGKTTRYRRAEAFAPTADDLKAFAGRFGNDESNAVTVIVPGAKGVMVRLNELGPLEFMPVDRDTFQLGGMLLRFRRDKAGNVIGFDYSNPIVRNVAFTARDASGGR
jgi:CubicO group peptidase (beta-lactamase class C family)